MDAKSNSSCTLARELTREYDNLLEFLKNAKNELRILEDYVAEALNDVVSTSSLEEDVNDAEDVAQTLIENLDRIRARLNDLDELEAREYYADPIY